MLGKSHVYSIPYPLTILHPNIGAHDNDLCYANSLFLYYKTIDIPMLKMGIVAWVGIRITLIHDKTGYGVCRSKYNYAGCKNIFW